MYATFRDASSSALGGHSIEHVVGDTQIELAESNVVKIASWRSSMPSAGRFRMRSDMYELCSSRRTPWEGFCRGDT
jgi:hypothetical protein